MGAFTGHHKIAADICKALGIEHATSLDIHIEVNKLVTVTVEFNAQEKDMSQLPTFLKKFKLAPIDEEA